MGEAGSYISGCVDMENNCAFRANFYEKNTILSVCDKMK